MEASGGIEQPEAALVAEERARLIDLALRDPSVEQALREGHGGIGRDGIAEVVDIALSHDHAVEDRLYALGHLQLARRRLNRRQRLFNSWLLKLLAVYWWIAALAAAGIAFAVTFYFITAEEIPAGEAAIGAGVVAIVVGFGLGLICFALWRFRGFIESRVAAMDSEIAAWERRLLEGAVLPELRVHIADRPFDRTLDPIDTRGLGNLFDPKYEVPVAATSKLRERLDELEAGSVGVAGSRGAGKTTLIRIACSGSFEITRGEDRLPARGVMVSAPVRYEARDFIRLLFEELCLSVLPKTPAEWRLKARTRLQRRAVILLFTMLPVVVLAMIYLLENPLFGVGSPTEIFWALSIPLALVNVGSAVVLLRVTGGSELEKAAERNLRHLRYLETVSQDVSGEVAAGGAKLGLKRGVSMAEQAWTLPDLIRQYQAFLGLLAARRPVVIGIDELDKMRDVEEARGFLNDMKSLFDQPDVYYLVSISEDALSDFERRGQPLRDVFDSVFADVIHVDCLNHRESSLLVKRRAIGVPPPWPALFHALSGGLPRETLRVARQAVRLAATEPALDSVTARLVVERARAVEHAAALIARRHVGTDGSQPFLKWLRGLPPLESQRATVAEAHEALLERLRVTELFEELQAHSERDGGTAGDGLGRVAIELAASSHHSLACLQFFADLDGARFDVARDEASGDETEIDLLARGQRDLSMSPALSWGTVTEFRVRTALEQHPYPVDRD